MPFAGFEDWDDCVQTMIDEGYDEESAESICGALQAEYKTENGDPDELLAALENAAGMIVDGTLDLVSGVDVPAIDSKWVMMKSDSSGHDWQSVAPILLEKQEDEEKRIAYAPAMIPREPDKEGEVVPTATVEKMAHGFLMNEDAGIDTDHSLIDGEGDVVESWILKEDRTFDLPNGGTETYPAGTWMLGVKWEAEPWKRIKEGDLTGLSIYGMAEHVRIENASDYPDCPGSKTAETIENNSQNGDSINKNTDETNTQGSDMTETDSESEKTESEGPTLESVSQGLDDLRKTVNELKEALDTEEEEKQPEDAREAAAILADEYGVATGEVLDALDALTEEEEDEDEEEMEESADDGETEKGAEETAKHKGHDGEGVRESSVAEKQEGDSGLPSFQAIAEEEA